jgi:hypothetical protein
VTYHQVRAAHRLPAGDRGPFLVGLARRHLVALTEIGPQPRPAEPVSAAHQRRHHRRELEQLQRLARVFGLAVPGVGDA